MMADYDDMMKIPGVNKHIQELNEKSVLLRYIQTSVHGMFPSYGVMGPQNKILIGEDNGIC